MWPAVSFLMICLYYRMCTINAYHIHRYTILLLALRNQLVLEGIISLIIKLCITEKFTYCIYSLNYWVWLTAHVYDDNVLYIPVKPLSVMSHNRYTISRQKIGVIPMTVVRVVCNSDVLRQKFCLKAFGVEFLISLKFVQHRS